MNRIARPVSVPIETSLQETVAVPVTTACNAGERNLLRGSTRPLGGVTFAAAGTDNAEQDRGRDSGVRVYKVEKFLRDQIADVELHHPGGT